MSTPTPTPVPAVELQAAPPEVPQGQVTVLRAYVKPGSRISGSVGGRALVWSRSEADPGVYWTVLGFAANSPPGPRRVSVTSVDGEAKEDRRELEIMVVPKHFPVEQVWLPPDQSGLLAPEVMTIEKQRVVALTSVITSEALWKGPFALPVHGEISSLFGTRRSYNGGPPLDYHGGADFDVPEGTPVMASAGGVVALAELLAVRGMAVVVDHGMGVFSGYYHLSDVTVTKGDRVSKGQVLGLSGVSGMATGPHLHWDVIVAGVNVSGLEWVERSIP